MNKTGKCMCGAVSFEIKDVQTDFGACHCTMCQRWAGSALLAFTVPADTITFAGNENVATHSSSEWAERGWCSKCGSGIWYKVKSDGTYHMPIGLLDDTSGMEMKTEIFVEERSNAFNFAGDHKEMTGAEVFAAYAAEDKE